MHHRKNDRDKNDGGSTIITCSEAFTAEQKIEVVWP